MNGALERGRLHIIRDLSIMKEERAKNPNIEERAKPSLISRLSAIWTMLTVVYSIVSTCLAIKKNWVPGAIAYAMIGILCAYILVFVVLVIYTLKNPKKGKASTKTYKITLGIFKALAQIVFLVLTAVTVAGLAMGEMGVGKWIVLVISIIVALVQLTLKVIKLVRRVDRLNMRRKYYVKTQSFVNGQEKRRTILDKFKDNRHNKE